MTDSSIPCLQCQTGAPYSEKAIRRKTYSTVHMHARIQAHTVSLSQCHRQTIHPTRFDSTHTLTISKQVHAYINTYALLMSYFFVHASQTCFVCRHISFTHTHIQALKLSHCSELYSVLPAVGGTKLIVELCDHVVRNTF